MVYLPKAYKNLYPKQKKQKYNNKKTVVDGLKFDSIKESKRYKELKLQEHCGFIKNLELQPKFKLQDGFKHMGKTYYPINYYADFRYTQEGRLIIEDVKGGNATKTDVYLIKKKLLLKQNPDMNFIET